MRLDKFLSKQIGLSRSQVTKVLRTGAVEVNGAVCKSGAAQISEQDSITYEKKQLHWVAQGQYIMLNKPSGYVCSHDGADYPTIYQFFDHPLRTTLHCAGRLDMDTTGLVLLTDDGQWSHRITSPKHDCAKTYLVSLADPIEAHYVEAFANGIQLRGEKTPTKPAECEIIDDYTMNLTISEGRYHQVKRMFAALGNKVIGLHRWRIGGVELDERLAEGEFRALTPEELQRFQE
ncbi:16S rRNA pseudouridine(516) synthase RsuA [Spirabiliibacterium falconis]|uniref:16S rRNA pseudouridine(516) synthase RsuA n=1 Tax=Spirabiliibacterium falconis TaxID=572023 RepID=UPI001AACB9C7|nr:16S rRNA pseudouridine(516) synthase RsuA [Spirabiliibacterium falconis]MBE2894797.1 16S rRNA pseudouridine(516) synthase RsuA [Spirabiliibacterium falconis]